MRKQLLLWLAFGLALLAGGRPALAQYEIDPRDAYTITPEAGEWVICVASYTGPEAPELAFLMANYVRTKHNMPAFIFNHADEERRQQKEEIDKLQAQFPGMRRRTIRVEEQCAVLIGGFKDQDAAVSARDKVRKWPLPDFKLRSGRAATDMQLLPVARAGGQMELVQQPVNPFVSAMVVRNPSVPRQNQQVKWDPFWERLNENEDFSLLQCPRPWTLVIKEYAGTSSIGETTSSGGILEKLWPFGNKPGQALARAGAQAHELARVLRQFGFPAYVLHTRATSIVTVGEFGAMNDPEILRTRQRLATLVQQISANNRDPRLNVMFAFMANPLPMEVPHPQ
jgi:hypothetical protein